MTLLKYIFAILVSLPILILGFFLLNKCAMNTKRNTGSSPKSKKNPGKRNGEIRR